jgi:hypothetical protein
MVLRDWYPELDAGHAAGIPVVSTSLVFTPLGRLSRNFMESLEYDLMLLGCEIVGPALSGHNQRMRVTF